MSLFSVTFSLSLCRYFMVFFCLQSQSIFRNSPQHFLISLFISFLFIFQDKLKYITVGGWRVSAADKVNKPSSVIVHKLFVNNNIYPQVAAADKVNKPSSVIVHKLFVNTNIYPQVAAAEANVPEYEPSTASTHKFLVHNIIIILIIHLYSICR